MPTIDITQAKSLLSAGRLDGRAVAVRGYWISTPQPSCPAPDRWMSPLESWCWAPIFSDVGYHGWTCTPISNGGQSCHGNEPPPGAHTISPNLVLESAGYDQLSASGNLDEFPNGVPAVLIVHRADPRCLQCLAQSRSECHAALVVDREACTAPAKKRRLLCVSPSDMRPDFRHLSAAHPLTETVVACLGSDSHAAATRGASELSVEPSTPGRGHRVFCRYGLLVNVDVDRIANTRRLAPGATRHPRLNEREPTDHRAVLGG